MFTNQMNSKSTPIIKLYLLFFVVWYTDYRKVVNLMNIEPLHLTEKDIKVLDYCNLELGRGTDGIVYTTGSYRNRNDLYKIYFHDSDTIKRINNSELLDKNGVKIIRDRQQLKNICNNHNDTRFKTNYIDNEGVRINGIDAINMAIERQKYIQRTRLQKRPILVDDHFRGTVLHYHKRQMPLYILKSFPRKIQIKVLKELLLAVWELLDNYVYHIDLGFQSKNDLKKANVLISCKPNLQPNIIDIDGKSAIYTEEYNEYYYYKSLGTYKNLMLQILFDIDIIDIEDIDFDYLKYCLHNKGIPDGYIDSLLILDKKMDVYEIMDFLNDMEIISRRNKVKTKSKIIY